MCIHLAGRSEDNEPIASAALPAPCAASDLRGQQCCDCFCVAHVEQLIQIR
jgi:hypothetical protein